jgi:hypothetical protein
MQIHKFLPKYPDIGDDFFNRDIVNKREFKELQLSGVKNEKKYDVYFNHQMIISRFLSSYTLYDELLLFWQPGTGKTCASIGAVENIIRNRDRHGIKRALILVKNNNLLKQFQREILYTCTNKKYLDEDESISFVKSRARPFYYVETYEKFFNRYNNNRTKMVETYSNSVIIIDEVHELTSSRMYKFYHEFLHSLKNRKIIIMSGTPMMNSASEIANVMNLILPLKINLPYGKEFDREYINLETGEFYDGKLDELQKLFEGRISYLKTRTDIDFEYQGVRVDDYISFPLVENHMSEFQKNSYISAFNSDVKSGEESGGFYRNSRDASLFVYPDGTYGRTGYNTFVKKRKNSFNVSFLNNLRRLSDEQKLEAISRYSAKYANIIRNIIYNKNENVFVYMTSITGSGAIIFGKCLELFGYSRTRGKVSRPDLRYAILSGETDTEWDVVKNSFNRKTNKDGKFIQVLIGGDQVKQGVTFWSIRQIHIATPEWNFSNIDQAIARGIRLKAHRHLEPNTLVRIYLHVSVSNDISETIDLKLYNISQSKDLGIKSVEYAIKTGTMDCSLTYNRNVEKGKRNGDRVCEYRDCIYRCKDVEVPSVGEVDNDTWHLLYEEYYIDKLIQLLQDVFKSQFTITLFELSEFFDKEYTFHQIQQSLNNIIKLSIVFKNKYGFDSYLHEENNIFFLTNDVKSSTSYLSSFYCENPVVRDKMDFMDVVKYVSTSDDIINDDIVKIMNSSFEEKKDKIPRLPIHIQQMFIEQSIEATEQTPLTEWVLDYYSEVISFSEEDDEKNVIVSLIPDKSKIYKNGIWYGYDSSKDRKIPDRLLYSDKGIYGIYKGKKKIFSIVDLRDIPDEDKERESLKRGQACKSLTIPRLREIVRVFDIQLSKDIKSYNKNKLCKIIETYFNDNNLVA